MDNLQQHIDKASGIAETILLSGVATPQDCDLADAMKAVCAALQLIKHELHYDY